MRRYKLLRTWSVVLTIIAFVSLAAASAGIVWRAGAANGAWDTAVVVAIGVPLALLCTALPLALAEALRALADIGEDMAFESLTTRASSPY